MKSRIQDGLGFFPYMGRQMNDDEDFFELNVVKEHKFFFVLSTFFDFPCLFLSFPFSKFTK